MKQINQSPQCAAVISDKALGGFTPQCVLEGCVTVAKPQPVTRFHTLMKKMTHLAAFAISMATLTSASAGDAGWVTDIEVAKKLAVEGHKEILLYCTDAELPLQKEVFDHESFKAGAKDKYVLMLADYWSVDIPKSLARQNVYWGSLYNANSRDIVLCDATGKAYAKHTYKKDSPEDFLAQLKELQAIRVKRDEAFAKADAAKTDAEKVAFLCEGIKDMDEKWVKFVYADVIAKIIELDREGNTVYFKDFKKAAEVKQNIAQWEEFTKTKLAPLMAANNGNLDQSYDQIIAEVKTFLAENPQMDDDFKMIVMCSSAVEYCLLNDDMKGAHALIDQLAKEYPNSEIAKNPGEYKASLKTNTERKREAENFKREMEEKGRKMEETFRRLEENMQRIEEIKKGAREGNPPVQEAPSE